jgi:hypothetical protein
LVGDVFWTGGTVESEGMSKKERVTDQQRFSQRSSYSTKGTSRAERELTFLEQQVVLDPFLLKKLEPTSGRRMNGRQLHTGVGSTLLLLSDSRGQRGLPLLLLLLLGVDQSRFGDEAIGEEGREGGEAGDGREMTS